jgi:hypothetical protein
MREAERNSGTSDHPQMYPAIRIPVAGELAEAQAEIARLTEERDASAALRFKLASALGFITEPSDDDLVRMANRYRDGSDDGEDQLSAQSGIVEAATAYVRHQANVTVSGEWIQRLAELKHALVTAVEEGNKA